MILAEPQIPDDATVTPGVEGFLVFAALAVIVLLLVLSMSRHLRKVDSRAAMLEAEEAERRAAEAAAADGEQAAATDPGAAAEVPVAPDEDRPAPGSGPRRDEG